MSPAKQRAFEKATPFAGDPRLRELLKVDFEGRQFFLYGFETKQIVCLRVAVKVARRCRPASCVCLASRSAAVARSRAPREGEHERRPRRATPSDRGRPADGAEVSADLRRRGWRGQQRLGDDGSRRDGRPPSGAAPFSTSRSLAAEAFGLDRSGRPRATGRAQVVPLSVNVSGQPALRTGLPARGPAKIERTIAGGAIGWFARREPRGVSARTAGLRDDCCSGFVRVIYPDPDDFLGVAIGDKTFWRSLRVRDS